MSPHLYGQQLPWWFVGSPTYWRTGHLPPSRPLRSKRSASLLESLPSFTRASRQHDYELARSSDHSPNELSEDEEANPADRAPLRGRAGAFIPPDRVVVDMHNLRKVSGSAPWFGICPFVPACNMWKGQGQGRKRAGGSRLKAQTRSVFRVSCGRSGRLDGRGVEVSMGGALLL